MPLLKLNDTIKTPSQEILKTQAVRIVGMVMELAEELLAEMDLRGFARFELLIFFVHEPFGGIVNLSDYSNATTPEDRLLTGLETLKDIKALLDDPYYRFDISDSSKWSRFLYVRAAECIVDKDSGPEWDRAKANAILTQLRANGWNLMV